MKDVVYVSNVVGQRYLKALKNNDMFIKFFDKVRRDFKKRGGKILYSPNVMTLYSYCDLSEYVKTLKKKAAHYILDKLPYVLLDFVEFGGIVVINGKILKDWVDINDALK